LGFVVIPGKGARSIAHGPQPRNAFSENFGRAPSGAFSHRFSFLETTPAILLRKTRFGDTSLIVTWFTLTHGKLKTAAKGALRPKSRFAGTLDLFFECEIGIVHSAKSDVHTLREVALRDPREGVRRDYSRVALGSYFVELVELATEPGHAAPEIFDLLRRAFKHLDATPATQRAMLHFESELARFLGIAQPAISAIVAIGRACHRIPSSRPGLVKTLPAT
jgi:DNA repair protein RecO (recombination protein O)